MSRWGACRTCAAPTKEHARDGWECRRCRALRGLRGPRELGGGGGGPKTQAQMDAERRPLGRLDAAVEFVCALGRGERPGTPWPEKPPTDRQLEWLERNRVEPAPGIDRGQAAALISEVKARWDAGAA